MIAMARIGSATPGILLLILAFQAEEETLGLARMMSNTSKGLAEGDSYVATRVRPTTHEGEPALEIIEEYRSGPNDAVTMLEKRTLPLRAIHAVALQRTGTRGGDAREFYLIITYRTASGADKVYEYRSEDSPAFGKLKSFRLGVYSRADAERIRDRLAASTEPIGDPPP